MAIPSIRDTKATKRNMMTNTISQIKFMQINLQHSRVATDNLMQILTQNIIDIAFGQEPYCLQNKVAGISRNYRVFSAGNRRKRAAMMVANKEIDAIMLTQLSYEDTVVLELIKEV
jgi:hypothetical protein